jgi:hypothetical protein
MKSFPTVLAASLTCAVLLAGGRPAKADPYPLSLALDAAFQSGTPGETLTFNVDITNLDPVDTIYLNADSYNLDSPLSLDDTGFFANAPFFLDPSTASGDFELFTVSIPIEAPLGIYTGSFEIVGGGPTDDTDVVGSADFDVDVTPEPSSLLLLATGLMVLGGLAKRKIFA